MEIYFTLQLVVSLLLVLAPTAEGVNLPGTPNDIANRIAFYPRSDCFPTLGFRMPQNTPHDYELQHWWCDAATEYAFVGFSYEVTACKLSHSLSAAARDLNVCEIGQSAQQLVDEFRDIRYHFNSRYVRLYGACDREGF